MTIRIAPFEVIKSGGHTHGHGPDKDYEPLTVTVQNGRIGSEEKVLLAACAEVYAKGEIDKKWADFLAWFKADSNARTEAMKKLVMAEVSAQLEPMTETLDTRTRDLFKALASAKDELTKAVTESVRKELMRLVEVEVRRVVSEIRRNDGVLP